MHVPKPKAERVKQLGKKNTSSYSVDTTHWGNRAPVAEEVTQGLTNGITQN